MKYLRLKLSYWLYRIDYCFCSFMYFILGKMINDKTINNELVIYTRNRFKKHLISDKHRLNYLKVKIEVLKNIDYFLAYDNIYIEVLKEDRFESEFIYFCIYQTLLVYAKENNIENFNVSFVYSSNYNETNTLLLKRITDYEKSLIIVSRLNSFCNCNGNRDKFFKEFCFHFVYKDCCLGVDNDILGLKKEFDYTLI